MKAVLKTLGKALLAVIHDPGVQRSGKQFALKIAARLALAVPGVAVYIKLLVDAFGH